MTKLLIAFVALLITYTVSAATIEQNVLTQAKFHKTANIMIEMEDRVDFKPLQKELNNMDWIERGRKVFKLLTEKAEQTQQETRELLKKSNIEYTNLWIQNTISAKNVPQDVLLKLSLVKSVGRVYLDGEEIANWEKPEQVNIPKTDIKVPEWGLEWINATKAWANGHTGKGIVLATADSGTLFSHKALIGSYRGNKGDGKIEHDFNWFDPVQNSRTPVDNNGHGTHVQGTVTGGVDRKIGVAPDAKWISCRVADRSFTPSNVIKCWQFVLAPTTVEGNNPNPDLRAHVCSHSYTCGTCRLDPSIEAHRAAGLFVVVSAGNSGPGCSTNGYPARAEGSLSIGALAVRSNDIARFSSRGPFGNLMKPAFALPGSSVVSSSRTGGYTSLSGTSMASPHMNGAIGVLWGAVSELVGKLEETEKVFRETALRQTSADCNTNNRQPHTPNNVFGYGSIDLNAAIELGKKKYQFKLSK